jgi:type VI secretion system secreted protein Hcp
MAVDYFLKLSDGIDGESVDSNHKNEIEIMSWSWGASQVSSVAGTGGSGAGKVDLSDFSITTSFDKATPRLFKSIGLGTHIKTGTLSGTKSGAGKPYLKIDFKELFITKLEMSAQNEIPTVNLSFNFNEIKIDYSVQDAQGNLKAIGPVTFNQKENKVT